MEKGILLPIFSLPSKYGVGDFGKEAYEFIDILSENNIKYWEILPINDGGQYPYSPISYYALNKNYISIDMLIDMGLIKNVKYKAKSDRITYDNFKEEMYKEAYSNFKKDSEYMQFIKNKRPHIMPNFGFLQQLKNYEEKIKFQKNSDNDSEEDNSNNKIKGINNDINYNSNHNNDFHFNKTELRFNGFIKNLNF